MANILVTGAQGYVGGMLVRHLLEHDHTVIGVDRGEYHGHAPPPDHGRYRNVVADVTNRKWWRTDGHGADAIIHLAALTGVDECEAHPGEAWAANVTGTANMALYARTAGIPLVACGSAASVGPPEWSGHPDTLYGVTKSVAEKAVRELAFRKFPAAVLHPTNIYGSYSVDGYEVMKRSSVVGTFILRGQRGDPLEVHKPGTQKRDFVHVEDVAEAFRLAVERLLKPAPPEYTRAPVCSGQHIEIFDLAELVARAFADPPDIKMVEHPRGEARDPPLQSHHPAHDAFGFVARHDLRTEIKQLASNA